MRLRDRLWIVALFLAVAALATDAAGSRTLLENALYCTAASGGVCRPAKTKLGDTVSVKDFGAVANDTGSAATNTLAFQAALDLGGTIYVPGVSGDTYYLNASITYPTTTMAIGSHTQLLVAPGVTIKQAASQNVTLITNKAYQTTQTSVVVTWVAGRTASVAWTGHPFAAGDYCAIKGAAQSAFVGVFSVDSITDANNFVIRLTETPTGVATGTITAVKADVDITIHGGTWNYNLTQNPSGTQETRTALLIGYAQRITVEEVRVQDCSLYALVVGSVRDYLLTRIHEDSTFATTVKIYGPAYNGEANFITGRTGDDSISVQAVESAAFLASDFTGGGSVFGCTIRNVGSEEHPSETGAVVVYLPLGSTPWKMDDITIDTVTGSFTPPASLVSIAGDNGGANYNSIGGTITIRNVRGFPTSTAGAAIVADRLTHVRNLVLENLSFDDPGFSGSNAITIFGQVDILTLRNSVFRNMSGGIAFSASATSIDTLNVQNVRAESLTGLVAMTGGTVTTMNFDRNSMLGAAVVGSLLWQASGAVTLSAVNFTNNHMGASTHSLFRYGSGTQAVTPVFTMVGNYVEAPIGIQNNYTMTVIAQGNTFVNASSGMLRLNDAGTQTFKLYAQGNQLLAGSPFVKLNGGELISVFSPDLKVDLAAIQRTAGSMAVASVNAGTILANNLAVCDATGVANSWKQVSNTALQF